MMRSLAILTSIASLFLAPFSAAQEAESLGKAGDFRVLYAGKPGGEREAAFLEFLRPWFREVDAIGLNELNPDTAADYDVVVADWQRRYGGDGGFSSERGHQASLPESFDKPIVMLGAVGGEFRRLSLITWL